MNKLVLLLLLVTVYLHIVGCSNDKEEKLKKIPMHTQEKIALKDKETTANSLYL